MLSRRDFLKGSALAAAGLAAGLGPGALLAAARRGGAKKVIVLGFDGMDPRLTERMMQAGELPHLRRLAEANGYRVLGTSIPPQSPVAWASFINGAGPGSHGIFDFIHRDPSRQCAPFFSLSDTLPGQGHWSIGEHNIPLDFWPFNHKPPRALLLRQGTPFWDYLDAAGIDSCFYDLPSNYPPSPSQHGHHRCLSGLGTPDLLGTYGTYQIFHDDPHVKVDREPGGRRTWFRFENETSHEPLTIVGPQNVMLKKPQPVTATFVVHRDKQARGAVIEIQGRKILLREGQWSRWQKLNFELSMPSVMPNKHVSGICRFYLQEVEPNFRLYVSPINVDPSAPAIGITEPMDFSRRIAEEMGLFYTTGFQEDYNALKNKAFTDEEYRRQATYVLQERLNLLDYALKHYDDGLLFFYFSSTDLQSHMFWWDGDAPHPVRSRSTAAEYFNHVQALYKQMDKVVGDVHKRYGDQALLLVMSDHGFCNFRRQFNLNTWLRDNGYVGPSNATSLMQDVDWSGTRAYGLGINGLYLNLKGRERHGIVPADRKKLLLTELTRKLQAVRDTDGRKVIHKVHRADEVYRGPAAACAPDLIVGYKWDYRASWETVLYGNMTPEVLLDNDSAWSADHCADEAEVPGVLFCNRPLSAKTPALVDLAPTILTHYGLPVPPSMTGQDIFKA